MPGPTPAAISRLPADRLARLLDPALPTPWTSADRTAALRHQLAAPLLPDLLLPPAADAAHLKKLLRDVPPPRTFRKLLSMPRQPRDLLLALKAFATHLRADPDSPLHGDPATLLYYAAIAAAALRLQQRLTTLTPVQLREGLDWCLAQSPPAPLKKLFHAARHAPSRL